LGAAVYAVVMLIKKDTETRPYIIIAECFAALLALNIPVLLNKIRRIKPSFVVTVCISIHMFMSVFLAEVLGLYGSVPFWDGLLHLESSLMITVLMFGVITYIWGKSSKKISLPALAMLAFMFALGADVIWELCEFSTDLIFKIDAQKFIPQNELYNGGFSNLPLFGTDEQIAAFFRYPSGYKYALMDTMYDLVYDFLGGLLGVAIGAALYLKTRFLDRFFIKAIPQTDKSDLQSGKTALLQNSEVKEN